MPGDDVGRLAQTGGTDCRGRELALLRMPTPSGSVAKNFKFIKMEGVIAAR